MVGSSCRKAPTSAFESVYQGTVLRIFSFPFSPSQSLQPSNRTGILRMSRGCFRSPYSWIMNKICPEMIFGGCHICLVPHVRRNQLPRSKVYIRGPFCAFSNFPSPNPKVCSPDIGLDSCRNPYTLVIVYKGEHSV